MTQDTTSSEPGGRQVISGLSPESDATPRGSTPAIKLDAHTYSRALDCVHCGLCLPACPTYTENGLEGDSPRGRIYLMKGLADGKVDATSSVIAHLDLCLDCRACETACPSGVVYHELIEETRAQLSENKSRSSTDRFVEYLFLNIFTRPTRLKFALLPARLLQKLRLWSLVKRLGAKCLPKQLEKMQQMLPSHGPWWESNLRTFYPAQAPDNVKRATVGFFAGCIGSVLFQHVNRQTIALLQHAGCDVIVPRSQLCCGAIHHHAGRIPEAQQMAKKTVDAFFKDESLAVDFIVNNISGCGAMLKDYEFLFRHEPHILERARTLAARVRDISELLVELNPPRPSRPIERTVTYHDACHLAHAQKVTGPPRELLGWINGLKVVPLFESDMCCGAAGTYNLTQPDMARSLAERKINHIKSTGAGICVTANVGCAMQIQSEAERIGVNINVVHPITLLHEAYFGKELHSEG